MTDKKLRWSEQTIPSPEKHYAYFPRGSPEWIEGSKKWDESYHSYIYQKGCPKCEEVNSVYTQKDNCPEYYADISIECKKCGSKILFELPVN